ncbi:MAG: hypothetical protein V4558_14150 [Gemmatimonadota bacterium]
MSDSMNRRDWIRVVGAASAALPLVTHEESPAPVAPPEPLPDGTISDLASTSDVFIPPRGDGYMKFSFDFPEPVVSFGPYRFGFMVFTDENSYGLDRASLSAHVTGDTMEVRCDGFVWAGGQQHSKGSLRATFRRTGSIIEWDVTVAMPHPVKTVTTVIRDIPRGKVGFGGGGANDRKDDELLAAYPFGGGDLHGPGAGQSMGTPLAVVQPADGRFIAISPLDNRVRPKRFYFQPGESAYRVEAIYEHDGWRNDTQVTVPRYRIAEGKSFDEAVAPHYDFIERSFHLPPWESRADIPKWTRDLALAVTLHGMHYTGFIFNDYAQQLAILRWIATQIPPERVLVFLAAWDGRYYWDYPNYTVPARMGGEAGFHALISEARKLGFRMMPMFGTNAANRKLPAWSKIAKGATYKIEGDIYNLNWVDWNNDRHQDGWLTYMNLGAPEWRNWLAGRIDDVITRFGVDAYFLDIVGGHVNSTNGDMHEGTRQLVATLRAKHPEVLPVGEMGYDALYEFIGFYQVGTGSRFRKYTRSFQHLSSPAPGRGSSGVHESGFGRFDNTSMNLFPGALPTLQVVDDTFTKHRAEMTEIIRRARQRASIT